MKIAIPLFGDRISPHFATAPEALFVQTERRRVCTTLKINLERLSSTDRRPKFLGLGVQTLICGGIDETTRSWFEKRGVLVMADRMGKAREVLEQYLKETRKKKQAGG